MATIHMIGCVMPDGTRARFFGTMDDERFHREFPVLPAGWLAWHVEAGGIEKTSEWVREIMKVPVLRDYTIADAAVAIREGLTPDRFFGMEPPKFAPWFSFGS